MALEFDPVTGNVIVPKFEGTTTEENIVFKCNWNDAEWKGICSKKAREFNISKKHSWCCDKRNPCSKMIEKNENGFPCIESTLFVDFKLDPGTYLKGKKSGEEKYFRGAQEKKIVLLTTIGPKDSEGDRYFIGILDIDRIEEERYVYGNKETSLAITPKIKIKFWNYFKNKDGSKRWSSGLFRYVNDESVLKVLQDLKREYNELNGFEREKKNLNILIERYKKYIGEE